jgi:hypothetical protein
VEGWKDGRKENEKMKGWTGGNQKCEDCKRKKEKKKKKRGEEKDRSKRGNVCFIFVGSFVSESHEQTQKKKKHTRREEKENTSFPNSFVKYPKLAWVLNSESREHLKVEKHTGFGVPHPVSPFLLSTF